MSFSLFAAANLVVFFTVFAMRIGEGFWSNAIAIVNIVVAGIIASNYFEPTAGLITEYVGSLKFFSDFLAFWLIFILSYLIMTLACNQASKIKVRFRKPVEIPCNLLSCFVLASFALMLFAFSIHLSPLEASPFKGRFLPISPRYLNTLAAQGNTDAQSALSRIELTWINFLNLTAKPGRLSTFENPKDQTELEVNSFVNRYRGNRKLLEGQEGFFP